MSKPTFLDPLIGKGAGQCELVYAERGSVLAARRRTRLRLEDAEEGPAGPRVHSRRLRADHRAVQRHPHLLDARPDRSGLRVEGRDDHQDVPRRETLAHRRLAGCVRRDRSGRGLHRPPRDRAWRSRRAARDRGAAGGAEARAAASPEAHQPAAPRGTRAAHDSAQAGDAGRCHRRQDPARLVRERGHRPGTLRSGACARARRRPADSGAEAHRADGRRTRRRCSPRGQAVIRRCSGPASCCWRSRPRASCRCSCGCSCSRRCRRGRGCSRCSDFTGNSSSTSGRTVSPSSGRCSTGSGARPALRRPAPAVPPPLLEPPPPKRHHRWWRRRSVWAGSRVVLLTMAAAAIVWAWPRPEGRWLREGVEQISQAALAAGQRVVQAAGREVEAAKSETRLQAARRAPSVPVLAAARAAQRTPRLGQTHAARRRPAPAVPPFQLACRPERRAGSGDRTPRASERAAWPGTASPAAHLLRDDSPLVVPPTPRQAAGASEPAAGAAGSSLRRYELVVSASGEVESVKLVSGQTTAPSPGCRSAPSRHGASSRRPETDSPSATGFVFVCP